jgi:hypothetical protein
VVIATFFNFSPELVRRSIPHAWSVASPEAVHEARLTGISDALTRVWGEGVASPELAEAAALARKATDGCHPEGRALYAAHAELEWPAPPHLQLWWALTLLREHRGDGHVAGLVERGITGCEALVLHAASGEIDASVLRRSRARTDAEWVEASTNLRERGWLGADGKLTESGRNLRADLEARTDVVSTGPWQHLGEMNSQRLRELVRPFSRAIIEGGELRP